MTGRSGRIVLALVLGLLTPVGCVSWQASMPQMMVPLHSPAANPVASELSNAQAAQLCLTAGDALEKKGFPAEAIQQYENARQYDPQARTVARRLAVLYDLQGDVPRAEAEYQRAMQEQYGDAELLNDFGYFHYRHNHFEVAEQWLRNAITVNASFAPAWINLGQVLAREGREEESYRAFAHVLRPAEAYSNLGVLLAKQGRTNEARRALQQAAALDPSLEQPRAFLKAMPSAPTLLLPANLARKTPISRTLPPVAKPVQAANRSLPRAGLDAPPPALMQLPPPQPFRLPPLRINPASSQPTPLSALPVANLAAPSDGPVIVNGPIQSVPIMSSRSPIVSRPWPSAPPLPPSAPPPPIVPRSSVTADAPILLRTSASFVQTSTNPSASSFDEPQSLPLAPSIPLRPAARTAPHSAIPAPPPQAILTDCQGEQQPESAPR